MVHASVRHVSIAISRAPADVYAYIADGEHLPRWASGVGTSVTRQGDAYVLEGGPAGRLTLKFVPQNDLGVLDHEVTVKSGESTSNPMRVIPHAGGSEVVFTLFRAPDVSDEDFVEDAATLEKDLRKLRDILER